MLTHFKPRHPASRERQARVAQYPRRTASPSQPAATPAERAPVAAQPHEPAGTAAARTSWRDWPEQRRRLEDHLQQTQKTEIIGRLATGIAHDFNIILMVILNNADLLKLRTSSDDPRHANIEAIRDAVTRGTGLARQLTAFNRQRAFQPKRFDLNRTIAEMTTLLRRLIGSGIRLVSRLSPDAGFICADPTQVEQVILNLIINARDSMPNGGQMTIETDAVHIAIGDTEEQLEPGEYLRLSVTDTGCGMSDDIKARIFDPLFTTKEEGRGTGVGLATVHGIVTRHGGIIQVDSVEAQGSTFRVFLPRGESVENGQEVA